MIYQFFERKLAKETGVFTDAVKDNNFVLGGETNHREQRCQEQGINLPTKQPAANCSEAEDNKDIVQHGQNGANSIT